MKILITNGLNRKTFDVVNILLRNYDLGSLIFCFSHGEKCKIKLIYGAEILFPLNNGKNFNVELTDIMDRFYSEEIVYLPIEETATLNVLRFSSIYGKGNLKFMLPDLRDFELSRNKMDLNIFCELNSIPCPKYVSKDIFQKSDIELPLIVKPIFGSGSKGIRFLNTQRDLFGISINFEREMVQELLPFGKDIEAGFYLCKDGKVLDFYSHKRIRTYPDSGGVSVFSELVENQDIKQIGADVISKLNWSGFIMIEFLFDYRENRYKLIEINPRLWGSILLSEFSGHDFIRSYVECSLGKDISRGFIKKNVFIRWLFPYDVLYFLRNLQNPRRFFTKDLNTCYINFTYSTSRKSIIFIFITYFSFRKLLFLFRK